MYIPAVDAPQRTTITKPIETDRLLSNLNIFGLDWLDPIILATLLLEQPLLLIGPAGSGKSVIVKRLALVLNLDARIYNASTMNLDDLMGYYLPVNGEVKYIPTPDDIFDAEVVFVDEISRCRPEVQNKFFTIIYDRALQGRTLPRLRYRFAAMNPPADGITVSDRERSDESNASLSGVEYEGSIPLDLALADRFMFIVNVPGFAQYSLEQQLSVVRHGADEDIAATPERRAYLESLLVRARQLLATIDPAVKYWAEHYAVAVGSRMQSSNISLSLRRVQLLAKAIIAVHVASRALGFARELADSAFIALQHIIPDRARGMGVNGEILKAIHEQATRRASNAHNSFLVRLLEVSDPFLRVQALMEGVGREDLSQHEIQEFLCDTFAELKLWERYIFTKNVLPHLIDVFALDATTIEPMLMPWRKALEAGKQHSWRHGRELEELQSVILEARLPDIEARRLARFGTALVHDSEGAAPIQRWFKKDQEVCAIFPPLCRMPVRKDGMTGGIETNAAR